MKALCAVVCLLALAGRSSSGAAKRSPDRLAAAVKVGPHVRLWIACSGDGPVVLADGGLGIPTEAWAGVRQHLGHVRFCAFDRAGIVERRSRLSLRKPRAQRRGCSRAHQGGATETADPPRRPLDRRPRRAALRAPLPLAGCRARTRRLPKRIGSGTAHTALTDGSTQLEFASGLRELRRARRLDSLPILILSHGKRAFSTLAAERSWTKMQRQLTADSSNTLRVIASTAGT